MTSANSDSGSGAIAISQSAWVLNGVPHTGTSSSSSQHRCYHEGALASGAPRRRATLLAALVAQGQLVDGLNNGVGLLPPMGYNTWNDMGCSGLDEVKVRLVADALVTSGLRDLGYRYVNLDDCWHDRRGRDPLSLRLRADPLRFPSGMAALGEYLHGLNLQFGIYTDRGTRTCAGMPGSLGFEELDAATFAEWGVDFVKEDNCYSSAGPDDLNSLFHQYRVFRNALNRTGRPIFFSVCGGGDNGIFANLSYYATDSRGGADLANSWRISSDCTFWASCLSACLVDATLSSAAGPGGFNDPDMLLGSTSGASHYLTQEQSRTQFNVWAILMAPLLLGAPVASLSTWDMETYTNKEVLDVSQDPLTRQGYVIRSSGKTLVWARELLDGDWAFVFQNDNVIFGNTVTCDTECWGAVPVATGTFFLVRDLWAHRLAEQPFATAGKHYMVSVPKLGGSRMFRLSPLSPAAAKEVAAAAAAESAPTAAEVFASSGNRTAAPEARRAHSVFI